MIKFSPLILLLTLFCCSDPIEKPKADPFKGMSKKERNLALENAHTRGSKKEQIQIEGYLKRHQIPAVKTGTGIHYCIYKQGEGNQIENGQNVVVDYVVTKINGDTLYTTQTKLDEFTVSNSEKESGLHEAIKLLKPGAKAIIVLPAHRAHGISGDMDKVPPFTTLIYNITVKNSF